MSDNPQGPGWWQASDGKWYPPEQAPGVQPVPAAAGPGVDVGAAFSWSIAKFQANAQPLLILGGAVASVSVIVFLAGFFVNLGLIGGLLLSMGGWLISMCLSILIVQAGLDIADGRVVDQSNMFHIRANIPYFVFAAIVFFFLSILGLLACCIGLIFVYVIFGLWPFAVVDRGDGAIQSLATSKNLTMTPGLGTTFFPMLIVGVLFGIGIRFGLLSIITLPFGSLFGAYVYRKLSGQSVAA